MAEKIHRSLIQKINSICDTYNLHISNLDPHNINKPRQTKQYIELSLINPVYCII